MVDLKVLEIFITGKTRRYELFIRGIYINLVFNVYLVQLFISDRHFARNVSDCRLILPKDAEVPF